VLLLGSGYGTTNGSYCFHPAREAVLSNNENYLGKICWFGKI